MGEMSGSEGAGSSGSAGGEGQSPSGSPASGQPGQSAGSDRGQDLKSASNPESTAKEAAAADKAERVSEKRKVKVNGAEREIDLDKVLKDYEKYAGAHELFDQGAAMRKEGLEAKKQAAALIKRFQEDPESILTDPRLGISADDVAERILLKKLEREMEQERERTMSPQEKAVKAKEKEAEDLQKRLKEFEDRDAKAASDKDAQDFEQKRSKFREDIGQTISQVMADTTLLKDAETMRSAALMYKACLNKGYEPTPEEIRERLEARGRESKGAYLRSLTPAELKAELGPEMLKALRLADLEEIKAMRQGGVRADRSTSQRAPEQAKSDATDKWNHIERVRKWAESNE